MRQIAATFPTFSFARVRRGVREKIATIATYLAVPTKITGRFQ
jgi:hypothetical protein